MGAAFHNLQGDNRLFFLFFFLFWPSKFLFSSSTIFLWEICLLLLCFFLKFKGHTIGQSTGWTFFFIVLVDIRVLQYFVWVFFLYFFFPFDDIDIVGLNSIIYLALDHFIFRLAFVRFVIQSHKCQFEFF